MAGGKRYKFQGSEIQILTGFGGSPLGTISAVTQANPAVVTETGHGRATGDPVFIDDVVGMVELNQDLFLIEVVDANSYKLVDIDSSAYGAYVSGGTVDGGVLSNFCELTNYNRQGGSSPEIPATSVCSTAAEYEIGLPDFGTTAIDFNFAPLTSSVQGALHDFYLSGDKMAVKVTLPRGGGSFTQLGFVQQESEQAANNGLWTASATIRNTGNRYDVAAA